MRRKNIYKSKLGTERAEHSTEILAVYPPQQSRAPLLRVKCSERYATCRHGWWEQQRRGGVWPGLCIAGATYVVISGYQLGARELLQNRNMKLIDFLIVSDAICHCDEGRVCSMTGVRSAGVQKAGGQVRAPGPQSYCSRAEGNKQTQVSLFNQIVSNFYLDKYHNIVECWSLTSPWLQTDSLTELAAMSLDLYTRNIPLTQKARFWGNYVSALKGDERYEYEHYNNPINPYPYYIKATLTFARPPRPASAPSTRASRRRSPPTTRTSGLQLSTKASQFSFNRHYC